MIYRTAAQIESAISILSSWFPQYCTRIPLPHASVEGRPISAMRMRAGSGPERRGVLIVGGTHAREMMNPDAIIDMAIDLITHYDNETDIVYGDRTFTADDIKVIMGSLDLWLLPCLNPDGREYVVSNDDLWRKNRRDNPGNSCDGVDINRNYGFLWGVTQYLTSCSPCSLQFVGSAAFSEPETKNVKALLDERRICCMVDVHSYSELVLYPWGHVPTQTTNQSKCFTNLPTGTCQPISQAGYQEYMKPADLNRFKSVGAEIVESIKAVRQHTYRLGPSVGPLPAYPTTGQSADYAYGRHIMDPSLRKIFAYTFEVGPNVGNEAQSFHPDDPSIIKRECKAGMLALAQQCICAIDTASSIFGKAKVADGLRRIRDEKMSETEEGISWITMFERVQHHVLSQLLADNALMAEAEKLLDRAGELLDDDKAQVTKHDVERAETLLKELADRTKDKRAGQDLEALRSMLAQAAGKTAAEAAAILMRHGADSN